VSPLRHRRFIYQCLDTINQGKREFEFFNCFELLCFLQFSTTARVVHSFLPPLGRWPACCQKKSSSHTRRQGIKHNKY